MHPFLTDLSLPQAIQKARGATNFEKPTPIQVQAIPVATKRKDISGVAQTGITKMAAFCIPTRVRLSEEPNSNALILAPTRELAQQIEGVWKNRTQFTKQIRSAVS